MEWGIMQFAAYAALIMSPVHAAFGLHIIRRGVIFIDLAVAQVAAFGMAVALARGIEPGTPAVYWTSVASALVGALLISLTRFKLGRVPHEAMIGIIFVLGSAASIIVLEYADHGQQMVRELLEGQILLVQPHEVERDAFIYGGIAVVTAVLWKLFTKRTEGELDDGLRGTALDFVFYALIGVIVASSVQVAGVLVVFTWLVMPAVVATTWTRTLTGALLLAVPLAWLGSLGGMLLSLKADADIGGWPTGASIVVVFGLMVLANYVVRLFFRPTASTAELRADR
jgi:zinc/manganese transport system permease protein